MKGLLRKLTETKTPARLRAEAMGFTFGNLEIVSCCWGIEYLFRGTFTCVCGRTEYFKFTFRREEVEYVIDWCELIERGGSFSREHLLADGYSEDEVDAMMARALAVDLTDAQMRENQPPSRTHHRKAFQQRTDWSRQVKERVITNLIYFRRNQLAQEPRDVYVAPQGNHLWALLTRPDEPGAVFVGRFTKTITAIHLRIEAEFAAQEAAKHVRVREAQLQEQAARPSRTVADQV